MRIIIKNGLVYSGREESPQSVSILVDGDRILRIGNFSRSDADLVIDAQGMQVFPGFVDVNTDSDHMLSIFSEPRQKDFVLQGVTTIIGGNCGASLAPLFRGKLDEIRDWNDPTGINVNWRSVKDFLHLLAKKGIGINFGTLVGHRTIRNEVTTRVSGDLDHNELIMAEKVIRDAFNDGAFGISFGLGYAGGKHISYHELKTFCAISAEMKRMSTFHLRDTTHGVLSAVEELLSVAHEAHSAIHINHFEPILGYEKEYREALARIEEDASGDRIHFDVYPFDAIAISLQLLLPPSFQGLSKEDAVKRIMEKSFESDLVHSFRNYDPHAIRISRMPAALSFFEGKTLDEVGVNRNTRPEHALLDIMRLSRLEGTVFYKTIDVPLLDIFMNSPRSVIASNGASLPEGRVSHERNKKTFTKFLQVIKTKGDPIERWIPKITSVPAQEYNIVKRGILKEGYYADITIVKDGMPAYVFVNGHMVVEHGAMVGGALSGAVLRAGK